MSCKGQYVACAVHTCCKNTLLWKLRCDKFTLNCDFTNYALIGHFWNRI